MKKTTLFFVFIFGMTGAFFQKLPAQTPAFTNYLTYADTRSLAFQGTSVWAATFNGVVQRDANTGALLNHFTKENGGLASNDVKFIAVDNAGTAWVTYGDHYLGKFVGGVWTNIDLSTYGTGLSGGQIFPEPAGGIWIVFGAYSSFGVLRVWENTVTHYNAGNTGGALMSNSVVHMAFAAGGKRLFAVKGSSPEGGLAVFDGVNWSKLTTADIGIGFNQLRKTIVDPMNNYWVLSDHILSKYDGNAWTNYPLPGESYLYFTDLASDAGGKIWTTIEGDISSGAAYLENGAWSSVFNHSNCPFYGSVFQVVVDGNDDKWFLGLENMSFSQKKIVYRYDNSAWHVQNMGIGQPAQYPEVNTMAKDPSNRVWAGMERDGMAKHQSGNSWSVFMENTIREKTFNNMVVDKLNRLVNFYGGNPFYLTTFDGTNYNTINGPTNEPLSYAVLSVDLNNHYWLTGNNVVLEYNGNSWTKYSATEVGVPYFEPGVLAFDDQNVKWLAGYPYAIPKEGLFRLDGSGWANYTTANSGIPSDEVRDVEVDHAGNKWVATANGIGRLQGNSWTTFNTSNTPALTTNNFLNVFVDKAHQNVWFFGYETPPQSSGYYVLLMKYHEGNWQKYTVSAIPSYFYFNITSNAIFDGDGNLWFAAREGASPCHPSPCYQGLIVRATPDGALSKGDVGNLKAVTVMAIDQSGTIWGGGTYYSIPNTYGLGLNIVSASGISNAGYDNLINSSFISKMEKDQSGNIWIGTAGGLTKMTLPPAPTYCQTYSLFPWEDWVAKVKVGAIDNNSGKSVYSDFTNLSTDLTAGAATPIELTTGFSYFTWDEYWKVWIDYNHDGIFTEPSELAFSGTKTMPANGTAPATLNGTLNVPASALPGATRMRVSMKRGAYATPCETLPFGEVEDYTVNISSGPVQSANLLIPQYEVIPANANCYALPGESFGYFAGMVLNNGTAAAGAHDFKGWFSKDQQLDANDVLWQSFPFTGPAPNNVVSWSFTNPVPASLAPGLYYVILQTDADNSVAESNENDNVVTVQVRLGAPDFTVSNVTGIPATTVAGNNLDIAVQAKNLAAFPLAEATDNMTAGIFLSADNQFDISDDLHLNSVQIPFTSFSNPPLYLNGIAWVNVNVSIPGNTVPGNYFIFVQLIGAACEQLGNNNLYNAIPIQITGGTPGNYCQSYSNFPWEEWIAKVELGSFQNASGKSVYSNFTNQTINLATGQSYPIKLTTGYSYFTWDEYWTVWIDFNHDGVFSSPNEVVQMQKLTAPAAGTPTATITGSVSIPAGALTGPTRMRVSMKRGAYATSCETLPFGEVEDYTVNIGGGSGGDCSILFATSNVDCQDNGTPLDPLDDKFTFSIMVNGNNTGMAWQMTWNGDSRTGNFGLAKTIGPLSLAAFQNSFNFTISDPAHPGCTTSGTLTPPPPCSIPASCGFNKDYVSTDGYDGLDIQQTVNGFQIRGRKYDSTAGYSNLILNADYDGNKTGSAIYTNDFLPLRDGNYLQYSVTADHKVKVVKKTPAQAEIWSLTYEVPNSMYTSLGNIIELEGGNLWAAGVFGDGQTSPNKIFASWISASGNNHWTTTATSQVSNTYSISTLKQSSDGGFFVTMTGGPAQNFFGKLSATGIPLWNVHIGGQYERNVSGVAEATDGSILVGVHTSGTGGQCTGHETLKMFTASGTLVWEKVSFGLVPPGGYSCESYLQGITHTLDGGFAVKISELYILGGNATTVASLLKINIAGDIVWTRNYGNLDGSVNFLTTAPDGGFLMTGQRNNLLWFMRTDVGGNVCVTPPPPPDDYCASQGDFPWHEWIARVKLNTLDNTSGKSQYSDFTGLSTTLQKGQSYPVTLTSGFSYFTWDEYWRVWIDYNHDGVFSTPDEVVQQQILTAPAAGTATASVTGSINIAVGALTGTTRIRVSMKRGGFASSCETFANGEVEDYTINIVNSLTGGPDDRASNLGFEAVRERTGVNLYGALHFEEAVSAIKFEKSPDGQRYELLTVVDGKQQAGASQIARTMDTQPNDGFNFYRMLILLENGEVVHSPVRIVSFDMPVDFTIFPNPAQSEIFIYLPESPDVEMLWNINDANGRVVWSQKIAPGSVFPYRVDVQELEDGMYYLFAMRQGKRTVARRFVVVR